MRNFVAATVAAILFASSALAATDSGALSAGKPAGVKNAQDADTTIWWVVGLGAAALGIGLIASGNSDNKVAGASTATATTTTP